MAVSHKNPRDGDTVLTCHPDHKNKSHVFNMAQTNFTRPDGTKGVSGWIVLCDMCFRIHHNDPTKAIQGDATWQGDEPINYIAPN